MNVVDILNDQPALEAIREKHQIDKERFIRGIIFAEYLVNGENANNSYSWAFECDKKEASTKSANFRNTKWVQELIKYFRPDEETLYFGEIRQIIRKGMAIIDNPNSEDKDIIAAMNALAKYVKVTKSKDLDKEEIASVAGTLIGQLLTGIEELSNNGKMVNDSGEIIDVPLLK